jgi:hypothetical protein
MEGYAADVERKMQRFFSWLSEKDRRRYAAIEAAKLGHGGVEYIARQGHSVFEFNTDESQCLHWLGSQPAASRRNVGMARPPQ